MLAMWWTLGAVSVIAGTVILCLWLENRNLRRRLMLSQFESDSWQRTSKIMHDTIKEVFGDDVGKIATPTAKALLTLFGSPSVLYEAGDACERVDIVGPVALTPPKA